MQLKPNRFTEWELTLEEEKVAVQFTHLQKIYIGNLIAKAAVNHTALLLDPEKVTAFIQQEADLKGQMYALMELLDAEEQLKDIVSN